MAKYLTKFNTSADYNSALFTLDLPNVSAVNGVVTYLTQYPISDCSWYVTDSSGNVVYGKLASVSTVVNTSEIPEEITNGKLYITASATSIQNIAANLSNAEIYGLPSDFLENISVQFMSNYPHEGFDLSNTETITVYSPFQSNTHITTADLRGITTMPSNPIFSGCPNIATVYSPKVAGSFNLGTDFTNTHIYIEPEIQELSAGFINNSNGGTDGVTIELKYDSTGRSLNCNWSNYAATINNTKIKKLIIDRCINSGSAIDPNMQSYITYLFTPGRVAVNDTIEEICFPDHDTHTIYQAVLSEWSSKAHIGKTTKFDSLYRNSLDLRPQILTTITCDSDNPYYSVANNALLSKDGTEYLYVACIDNPTIPNTVTTIKSSAFHNLGALTTITIPNTVSAIEGGAFDDTPWYNNLPDGLNYAGKVAYKYKGTMPNNTSITLESGTLGIAGNLCTGYTQLSSVSMPNSVTNIGSVAFTNCTGLTTVTMSDNVTSIGIGAFSGCYGLTSITIPSGVTRIENGVFGDCRSLTSITIPSGVTAIGDYAFNGCFSMASITVEATTPPTLGTSVFDNTNNCPIYVPAESVDAYKAASNWSTYASRIQAIPSE